MSLGVHIGTGRLLAYVDLTATTIDRNNVTENSQFWTGYGTLGSYGGGALGRDGQVLRGAGDVAEWAMLRDGMRVDFGRMAAAKVYLNRYLVDTYINDPTEKAWTWLESEILRLLPVVVLESSEGKYLRFVQWRPTARDAVAHLDADRGQVVREGGILVVDEERRNQIEVRYRGAFGDRWNSRVVLSAEADPDDSRVLPNELCRLSQAQLRGVRGHLDNGTRPYAVDGTWVWTDSTAYRIASDLAARYALTKRSARFVGGWNLETIEPWDVVTVTDSEVDLANALALVQQRVLLQGRVALDLLLLPSV